MTFAVPGSGDRVTHLRFITISTTTTTVWSSRESSLVCSFKMIILKFLKHKYWTLVA